MDTITGIRRRLRTREGGDKSSTVGCPVENHMPKYFFENLALYSYLCLCILKLPNYHINLT